MALALCYYSVGSAVRSVRHKLVLQTRSVPTRGARLVLGRQTRARGTACTVMCNVIRDAVVVNSTRDQMVRPSSTRASDHYAVGDGRNSCGGTGSCLT